MNDKWKSLIELVVNEEEDKAKDLFHEIAVDESRKIYENLIDEEDLADIDEASDEAVDEAKDETVDEAEETKESTDEVEEASEEKVEENFSDDETADMVADIKADEVGMEEADDEGLKGGRKRIYGLRDNTTEHSEYTRLAEQLMRPEWAQLRTEWKWAR